MKNLTLNGDWAIATAAFAQFYDSFEWDNSKASENCPFNNARCASIKSATAAKGADTIKKMQRLVRLISAFIFFVLYLDDIGSIT